MKQKFREIHLSKANKVRLDVINSIVEEYQDQGYVLTLRQLYYQLVSRDVIPNQQKEYAKLSKLLKEGRMAGIVDWDAIEDRLRKPSSPPSWDTPEEFLDSAVRQFSLPRMKGQDNYIEVWVEKDALSGVLSRVTRGYHVPILVNRGYSSASAMYDSYNRFSEADDRGQNIKLLYLGDYDPSGMDMIRDITDRINEFFDGVGKSPSFEVIPIALTRAQITQYNPPPNPAKKTDPRAAKFIHKHGATSWEVDALRPEVLNTLLTKNIEDRLDMDSFNEMKKLEAMDMKRLKALKNHL